MSTHVVGIRPPDEKWTAMKSVYAACVAAGVTPPDDVLKFLGIEWGGEPDPLGVVVDIEKTSCVRKWNDEHRSGFEVHVGALPKDVTVIRFYNSW